MWLKLPQIPLDQNKSTEWLVSIRGIIISQLHDTVNIEPNEDFIHRLTAQFVAHCPSHYKLPVQQIGNYALSDL
jgi:hypothetical protein